MQDLLSARDDERLQDTKRVAERVRLTLRRLKHRASSAQISDLEIAERAVTLAEDLKYSRSVFGVR